ncbi:hypothetical protein [Roseateles violae]|uniref:Uncharacterized protein n=1 Tax=Roseateles violae TaxID=3058042 RepID=A0ABT8DP75_9BURK|nr:hypothetical protein [Pelomonas sp. PFR6]MDN3920157.1 hypothetical protein [Pelomonas sp. PFR6]
MTMPSDRARAESARVAGQRALVAGAALWRALEAIGAARGRRALRELALEVGSERPQLAAALLSAQRQTVRG